MDNRTLDVVSEGRRHLELAMTVAWADDHQATHYRIVNVREKTDYHWHPKGPVVEALTKQARAVTDRGNVPGPELRVVIDEDKEFAAAVLRLLGGPALCTHHYTQTVEDPKGRPTLVLYHSAASGAQALPFPLDLDGAVSFVWGWLTTSVDYGREPDHDGDNSRGFRVF